jgi:hypothetical protein
LDSHTNRKLVSAVPLKSPVCDEGLDLRYYAVAADAVAAYIADDLRDLLAPMLIVPPCDFSAARAYEQMPLFVSSFLCADADITDGRDVLRGYLGAMVAAEAVDFAATASPVSACARVNSNRLLSPSAASKATGAAVEVVAAIAAADDVTRRGERTSDPPLWLDAALDVIRTWCEQVVRKSARRARCQGNDAAFLVSIRVKPPAVATASPHRAPVGAIPLPPLDGGDGRPVVVDSAPAPSVNFAALGYPAATRAAREREAAVRKHLAVENSKLQGDVARQAETIAALTASKVQHEATVTLLAEANAKLEAAMAQFAEVRAELESKAKRLTEDNEALAAAATQRDVSAKELASAHSKLGDDAVQLAEANAALQAQLADATSKLEAGAAQLADANAALDGSKAQHGDSAVRLAVAEAAVAAMKTQHQSELSQAQAALHDLKIHCEADRTKTAVALADLKAALEEATSKGRAMQARAELGDSERDGLRQQVASLTAELASCEVTAATAAARCEQHEREHALIVTATRAHACTAVNAYANLTAELERAMLAATDVFVGAVMAAGTRAAPVAAAPAAGAAERLLVEEAEARADEIMSFHGSFRRKLVRLATTAAEEGAAKRAVAQAGAARQERQISAQAEKIAELLRRLTPAAAAGAGVAPAAAPAVGAASATPAGGAAATTAPVAASAASATPAAAAPPAAGLNPAAAAPPVVAPVASAAAAGGAAAVASAAASAAAAAATTPATAPATAPAAAPAVAPAAAPAVAPVAAPAAGAPVVARVSGAAAAGAPAAGGAAPAVRVADAHARPVVVNSCTFCKKMAYGVACPRNCGGWWCPKPACKTRCAADASRCPNCNTPYDQDDE